MTAHAVQVAAVPEDISVVAQAASDVDDIKWVPVTSLRQHQGQRDYACSHAQYDACSGSTN